MRYYWTDFSVFEWNWGARARLHTWLCRQGAPIPLLDELLKVLRGHRRMVLERDMEERRKERSRVGVAAHPSPDSCPDPAQIPWSYCRSPHEEVAHANQSHVVCPPVSRRRTHRKQDGGPRKSSRKPKRTLEIGTQPSGPRPCWKRAITEPTLPRTTSAAAKASSGLSRARKRSESERCSRGHTTRSGRPKTGTAVTRCW